MNPPELTPVAGRNPAASGACWKQAGTWGDASCEELLRHVHCRNCPQYSSAASRLLDRPLPPLYREEWSGHFIEKKAAVNLRTASYVAFLIGDEWLGLPTRVLQEVAPPRAIRTVPHRRQGVVLGLVNVRGELVICACLRAALWTEDDAEQGAAAAAHQRLLIVYRDGERFAFPVDQVQGIVHLNSSDLREVPATVGRHPQNCLAGVVSWQGRSIGLIDDDRLFQLLNRSLG
jgi:chemotaxis-related protein WspD